MKNDFEIRGDVTSVLINSPKHGKIETLISTCKLERAKEFKGTWYAVWDGVTNSFYINGHLPINQGKRKITDLHRWITNAPSGMVVDHRNHDTLDNTDENLRIVTHAQNQQNRKSAQSNNKSSGLRGVTWDKKLGRWRSYIRINGKQKHLGFFNDILEAERAAIESRKKYMPYSHEA